MRSEELVKKISFLLFDYFVVNKRYFAIQKFGYYVAERGCVNEYTINRILQNKESFLCYQEDFNLIKWICFDFDINKELYESDLFNTAKKTIFSKLVEQVSTILDYLDSKDIEYLIEYSGNRGIHVWIIFDEVITRQDGFLIFKQILSNSHFELDNKQFSLDKYPKSLQSKTKTDKGTGVKIPLSFHQKSLKYSALLKNINSFDLDKVNINEFCESFLEEQYEILTNYVKQNKNILFGKLDITKEIIEREKSRINFLDSKAVSFDEIDLEQILKKLSQCKHLESIFSKSRPSEKEARIIVGLLGQLRRSDKNLGKVLLYEYFMSRDRAVETIIKQRLKFSNKLCPPTCDFFRNEYNEECSCQNIEDTPLQYLDNFSFVNKNLFEIDEDIFHSIVQSQIKYTKHNDEVALFHIINNLYKSHYHLVSKEIESFFHGDYKFDNTYMFTREESEKKRVLHSLSAKDKIITTYSMKVLDSIFYKKFSSRSYGYRFNPSFRNNEIFENWFKQWNIYISELKTIIYSEDFKEYKVLKIDLKSFYDSVDLEKLQIELIQEVNSTYTNQLIEISEKNIYVNIIENLMKFTKEINNGSSVGLPQGPAYARYLAELYLSSLDKVIERKIKSDGYYFRYVDDIFIIVRDMGFLNEIYDEVKQHLDTKYLRLNETKEYKGTVKGYIKKFSDYIDNTKYFVDKVSKNQSSNSKTTIHSAATKLIELVEDKEGSINESNLTFLFTHLKNIELVEHKKISLENYIITSAKGRGSFFNIFWKYYFDKYSFNNINFNSFNELTELKRITLLNRILIVLKRKEQTSLPTLKELLDYYLTLNLTKVEQLLLLEIYVLDNSLYNSYIITKIDNDFSIYNDLMLSEFSKNLPIEVLEKVVSVLLTVGENERLDYLYNIMLYSENQEIIILNKLSKIFVDTVNSIISSKIEEKITYIYNKSTSIKYIQLLYLASLFYREGSESFENRIVLIWQNLFSNLERESFISLKDIERLSFWTFKVKAISLKDTNINFIMPIIKDEKHNVLTKYNADTYGILVNYFDSLIELIYISNTDLVSQDASLQDIKQILINKKNVKYLEWLDGDTSIFYPTKDICLRNAIFNDIIILWKDNKILVRLKNELQLKKSFDYIKEEVSEELIFDKKYKTIIFKFDINNFKKPYDKSYKDIFQFLVDLNQVHKNLKKFMEDHYYDEFTYINHFYENFFIMNDEFLPLIAYEGFNKYFITDTSYNIKNEGNYFNNLTELIQTKKLDFFFNEPSKIFTNFSEHLYPQNEFNDASKKLEYLDIFVEKIKLNKPTDIFQLETYLVSTIIQYFINNQITKNFYEIIEIYLSFNRNREHKKYIIFDNREVVNDENLNVFIGSISDSLISCDDLASLWQNEKVKISSKLQNLEEYAKAKIDYKVVDEGYEVTINEIVLILDNNMKYNYLDEDNASFHEVTADKLDILKNSLTFYKSFKGQFNIIVIPPIIRRTFEVIQDRNSIYKSGKHSYLFKPFKSLTELSHYPDFGKAIKVLENHYYYNEKFENLEAIKQHLFQWLKPFKTEEEILSILYVIAHHKYISTDDSEKFVSSILDYRNKSYLITTLKDPSDNNGTHRLINLKTDKPDLWRETDIKDFPKALLGKNSNKLVLLCDVSISGSQIVTAFENYYLKEDSEIIGSNNVFVRFFNFIMNHLSSKYIFEDEVKKHNYYKINILEYDNFKKILLSQKEIVFLCGLFTDAAEEKITNYLVERGFKGKITFCGKRELIDDCIFKGLRCTNEVKRFKNIISNEKFIDTYFHTSTYYKNNSELRQDDGELAKRNLVVRYNSMPKKRFFLFTLKPRDYENSLFQIMKD